VLLAPLTIPRLPATILLVEDETFVREVASQILHLAGYRVLEARNAADALLAFRCHANHLQLLLADVVLPDRNGADLAHELTTESPHIRTILPVTPKTQLPERDFGPDGPICPNQSQPIHSCKRAGKSCRIKCRGTLPGRATQGHQFP